jgi:hypothetical protein
VRHGVLHGESRNALRVGWHHAEAHRAGAIRRELSGNRAKRESNSHGVLGPASLCASSE